MSKHKVAEKPADPVICRSKREAVGVFTRCESSNHLFKVELTVVETTATWYVFARGPVSAREAVLKTVTAERVPDDVLWGWLRDELVEVLQQSRDSLEGGTGVPEGASDE